VEITWLENWRNGDWPEVKIKFNPPPPSTNFDLLEVSFHHENYNYQFKKSRSDLLSQFKY
jgi:hypothetical protein